MDSANQNVKYGKVSPYGLMNSELLAHSGLIFLEEPPETRQSHPHLDFETRLLHCPDGQTRVVTLLSGLWRVWDFKFVRFGLSQLLLSECIDSEAHGGYSFKTMLRFFLFTWLCDMLCEEKGIEGTHHSVVNINEAFKFKF